MTGANDWDPAQYDARFGFVGRYGDDLLALLAARAGERILDLGCGTGRHAAQLADAGCDVVGADLDSAMLQRARALRPSVAFVRADATAADFADSVGAGFDACLSNAALHWMAPLGTALRNVRSVLRDGGRFVAEMGGSRNIAALDASLRAGLADLRIDAPVVVNTFPTPDEVTGLLEEAGFGVELVAWFIRPTPLESTAAEWTQHFRTATWDAVPPVMRHELVSRVDAHAADAGLLVDGTWFADYCRLRFVARAA